MGVGVPNGAGVGEEGLDDGLVCRNQRLFAVTPCCASQGLQHLEALLGLGLNCSNMFAKREAGVKGDTQDLGGTFYGQAGLAKVHDRIVAVDLCRVRSEEGRRGFA